MKSNEFIFSEELDGETIFWSRLHGINIVSLEKDLNAIERGIYNNKFDEASKLSVYTTLDDLRIIINKNLSSFVLRDKKLKTLMAYLDEVILRLS